MIHTHIAFIRSILIALFVTMATWLTSVYAETKYKLSVTPRFASQEILTRLGPLAQFLTEKLHSPVEIVLAGNFDDYEERLKTGQFDIAFSNPIHYAEASATNEVIAMEQKDDETRIRGIIIARTDGDIQLVNDLIGKTVAIVSWTSTAGFLSQKVFLEAQGINLKTQLKLQEAHDNKQENVVLSVYHGDVSAGFINEDALHIVDRYVPSSKIQVIAQTAWLPGWALSVKRTLPEMVKAKIRQAVLELSANDPVLKAIKLQNFVAATDADYDVVRKALDITADTTVVPIPTDAVGIKLAECKCPPTLPCASPLPVKTAATPAPQHAVTVTTSPVTIVPVPIPIPIKTDVSPVTTDVQTTSAATNNNANSEPNESPKPVKKSGRKRKGKK